MELSILKTLEKLSLPNVWRLVMRWFHTERPDAAASGDAAECPKLWATLRRRAVQRRAVQLWADGQAVAGYHLPDEWN